ncbi:fused MFS/spermidine synthase, partial [Planctomycetota bacterium]
MPNSGARQDIDYEGRFTPALLILFVGSGCSALIYEIVWFHLLRLVIGASAISLGFLLASFMGGMCLGSLFFARLISGKRHPLRVYALLELGIGVMGLSLLWFFPSVNRLYLTYGQAGILLRAVVGLICLLPPTILMGATLPAISRWMETTRTGISKMGFFYGANIVGAVIGTLLAGFYLLRVYDTATATYVAATLNAIIALVALILAGRERFKPSYVSAEVRSNFPFYPTVYIAIALSGLTALGAEVLWTRLLSLLFGPTVYTFAIILAVFLAGLGFGSSFGSLLARMVRQPRIALGWCQLILVACISVAAYMITEKIPYWEVKPDHFSNFTQKCIHDLIRCAVAIGPAAFFWGASFPLALAAAASEGQDPGRLVGGVYAANTVGAIAGALLFSLVMTPYLGTHWAQRALIMLSALAALLMFASAFISRSRVAPPVKAKASAGWLSRVGGLLIAVLICGFTGLMVIVIPPVPKGLIAYGRMIEKWTQEVEYLYEAEGINASVAVSKLLPEGTIKNFHVSGKVVASSDELDMRLQRMLGHLPALIHSQPKSVLIVGCGAGVTAGTFVIYPEIEKIVICEIEPRVFDGAEIHFGPENYDVLKDPRTVRIYDDARHYLSTTKEKFDI